MVDGGAHRSRIEQSTTWKYVEIREPDTLCADENSQMHRPDEVVLVSLLVTSQQQSAALSQRDRGCRASLRTGPGRRLRPFVPSDWVAYRRNGPKNEGKRAFSAQTSRTNNHIPLSNDEETQTYFPRSTDSLAAVNRLPSDVIRRLGFAQTLPTTFRDRTIIRHDAQASAHHLSDLFIVHPLWLPLEHISIGGRSLPLAISPRFRDPPKDVKHPCDI
jgi:hypothetical protein